MGEPAPEPTTAPYSLAQLVAYFLRLGAIGFGGPVALTGYMQRDLVEQRNWISDAEYKDGLALAQLAPGPLAAQLAFYLGFVHHGAVGATLVGLAFVLPSFALVVAAGWAYVQFQGLAWIQDVFYGVGAAVIGIIANSAYKLTRRTIGPDRLLLAIFAVAAAATVITESESVLLFLTAGVLVWMVRARPRLPAWPSRPLTVLLPAALAPAGAAATHTSLMDIALFFGEAGAFVFGSGLAIVPFLYGGVVKEFEWLTDRQFLDAVAVALITPGPVVITTGFIGYLVRGLPGAIVAAAATFLPCFLLTIVPAPWFRRHGRRPAIAAFVDGVTAAAIGAITGAVVVLGRRSVFDLTTLAIALAVFALLLRFGRRAPEPALVLVAAILGLALGRL